MCRRRLFVFPIAFSRCCRCLPPSQLFAAVSAAAVSAAVSSDVSAHANLHVCLHGLPVLPASPHKFHVHSKKDNKRRHHKFITTLTTKSTTQLTTKANPNRQQN